MPPCDGYVGGKHYRENEDRGEQKEDGCSKICRTEQPLTLDLHNMLNISTDPVNQFFLIDVLIKLK